MSTFKKKVLNQLRIMYSKKTFGLVLFTLTLCIQSNSQTKESFVGNVYINQELFQIDKENRLSYIDALNSAYPINSIRVDRVLHDTIHIKYRFGYEAIMNMDIIKQGQTYRCVERLLLSPNGSERVNAEIIYINSERIILKLEGDSKEYEFLYSYRDNIDIRTYRNPYYSEDGYSIFKTSK